MSVDGELSQILDRLEAGSLRISALSVVADRLLDAVFVHDRAGLERMAVELRRRRFSNPAVNERCAALLDVVVLASARMVGEEVAAQISADTVASQMLQALAQQPGMFGTDLVTDLDKDASEISRTGRKLVDQGLVRRRKIGRNVRWELTPRGRQAIDDAESGRVAGVSPPQPAAH